MWPKNTGEKTTVLTNFSLAAHGHKQALWRFIYLVPDLKKLYKLLNNNNLF